MSSQPSACASTTEMSSPACSSRFWSSLPQSRIMSNGHISSRQRLCWSTCVCLFLLLLFFVVFLSFFSFCCRFLFCCCCCCCRCCCCCFVAQRNFNTSTSARSWPCARVRTVRFSKETLFYSVLEETVCCSHSCWHDLSSTSNCSFSFPGSNGTAASISTEFVKKVRDAICSLKLGNSCQSSAPTTSLCTRRVRL